MMKQGANFTGEISTSKQPMKNNIFTLENAFSIVIRLSWHTTLLQILLGRGIHIDFSSQLKFAKIEFYGAFYL